ASEPAAAAFERRLRRKRLGPRARPAWREPRSVTMFFCSFCFGCDLVVHVGRCDVARAGVQSTFSPLRPQLNPSFSRTNETIWARSSPFTREGVATTFT